jgi:hypothetical protein
MSDYSQAAMDLIESKRRVLALTLNEIDSFCVGKRVKIISNYNGQPHGRSKPPLTGRIFEVEYVSTNDSEIQFGLKGQNLFVRLHEVEFVP